MCRPRLHWWRAFSYFLFIREEGLYSWKNTFRFAKACVHRLRSWKCAVLIQGYLWLLFLSLHAWILNHIQFVRFYEEVAGKGHHPTNRTVMFFTCYGIRDEARFKRLKWAAYIANRLFPFAFSKKMLRI